MMSKGSMYPRYFALAIMYAEHWHRKERGSIPLPHTFLREGHLRSPWCGGVFKSIMSLKNTRDAFNIACARKNLEFLLLWERPI